MTYRQIFRNHGYTLTQVADMIGTTKGSLSGSINRGKLSPTTLRKIAEAIGASLDELLEVEKPRSRKKQNDMAFDGHALDGGIITIEGKRFRLMYIPID